MNFLIAYITKNKLAIGHRPAKWTLCIQSQFYIATDHMARHIYDTSEKEQRRKNPQAHQDLHK